tara:strand:- start:8041 stop:9207 length:1167 start_codon:yes stop_codon:yes gene_type:complete
MNKYLIIATDDRSYLDLKNVAIELKNRNLPFFFLYSNTPHRISPKDNINNFSYDTNVEFTDKKHLSQTLGFNLPFKPDVLLITNENWEPEKSILWEFKQWGCFIGCIENASRIYVNIKSKLELTTRKSFPVNCIDIFFDHSEWGKESKTICGWYPSKSIVTGNPRNDNILKSKHTKENIIIVYGSMENETHYNLLDIYRSLLKLKEWKIYYKPHPSEIRDFPNDFKDIEIIKSYKEYFELLLKSHHHIGMFSSVMYYPLVLDKNIIFLNTKTSGMDDELNIENYKGHEFNFWSRVFANEVYGSSGFSDFQEFHDYIGNKFIEKIKKRNKKVEKHIGNNLVSYKKDHIFVEDESYSSNNLELLSYFDEFNDGQASKRIIDYTEYGFFNK